METNAAGDFVDRARAGWERSRPGLDVSSIEVMGRISRIGAQASHRVERGLAAAAVSRAEFDVLCALARSERPLRASEVTAATMLSGASTTKNVDRLARRGLVERLPWERDGRVVLMQLTALGTELVDREFPHLLDLDREALAGLDAGERELLAALLRKVSAKMEPAG
ncbi:MULTISPECIES: MarR family winged helix-turn-helix transcriptional regulator [unclassified Arthrobacter]|uniref:MarR family winged helix-turn-helix transcriptional regulator n=1 Tax=unclassified Arthrobacter TaxID=235627 RepID=UPI00159D4859|nr:MULTISPECIES: MarR family winged helix-turn-helix transcriptional regulator [unclassified Arthrobacter]MCQ9165367.1 MarR family winged helix-turn-helix transcriptional regulator [Arthrobacter sp. STN4]NVM99615.1 winged helix-turn-helix transcriptional regulator [Arthrobacter sp. SDTb3-6]